MAKRKKRVRKKESGVEGNEHEGLLWVQEVQVRRAKERRPMANLTRWKKRLGVKAKAEEVIVHKEGLSADHVTHDDEFLDGTDATETPKASAASAIAATPGSCASFGEDYDSDDEDERRQFTVSRNNLHASIFERLFSYCRLDDVDEYSYRPSKLFTIYINWTFRRGFMVVFTSFLFIFFVINVVFALLMWWAGNMNPQCIVVSGEDFGYNPDTKFADAFSLSWTTFTTVG
mmetsp:Transcript_557/g.1715  ORF Transcript_557/g.1715 Transcript_557/m.1715 type:complete len:231 (+) Transcript_557:172-864(+)